MDSKLAQITFGLLIVDVPGMAMQVALVGWTGVGRGGYGNREGQTSSQRRLVPLLGGWLWRAAV